MGTTYRAQDTKLHRAVALKVINRSVAEHPDARARFLREARAAAQFQHPNVATVSHYGEQDGECFYAMELVAGETLEARVRRDGPLSAEAALAIATQVALALAAAETHGIVHRDLKPSNIMLAAAGSTNGMHGVPLVKVIDFGLAKAVSMPAVGGLVDTRGAFVGTPAFASPEQFARTEDERIDTRSDIYSLGVTLWYLLCGKLPFVGRTLTEIHEQQTRQPLPLNQLKTARVPGSVASLLCAMLAVSPSARPQSARELLAALERARRALPPQPHVVRRRRFAQLAGALALLAVTGTWLYRASRPPPPPPDRSLAVLPFENRSTDPSEVFFTTSVQDEITADLARLPELTVTNSTSTKEYVAGRARDPAAIGRALGVGHLLEGTCRREAQQLHIALQLIDVRDPRRSWIQQYDRPLADVFAVQGEIARAVADQLQLSLSPAEKATINRPPTRDLVAYELYRRSLEGPEIFPNPASWKEAAKSRIALLDQAVALDPNFLLAYCKLARQHGIVWTHSEGAEAREHRDLADLALQKARDIQADAGEVHLAVARHLLDIQDRSGQVLVEAERAQRAMPNNSAAASLAAQTYRSYGRYEDAVRAYNRVTVLNPRSAINWLSLANTYKEMRRYGDYDRAMGKVVALAPANETAEMIIERAMGQVEANGDLDHLRQAVASITQADDPDGGVRFSYNLLIALLAHDPETLQQLNAKYPEPTYDVSGFPFPRPYFNALAARMRGDDVGARTAFAAARQVMEKSVSAYPINGARLGLLAIIDAGLGRREDAVKEGQHAVALEPYGPASSRAAQTHCELAVVYAWTGQPDLAFTTLEEAVKQAAGEDLLYQPTYGDFVLNPVWDPLRSDPRFAAIVKPLALVVRAETPTK